jgi:hypothetical protein
MSMAYNSRLAKFALGMTEIHASENTSIFKSLPQGDEVV